MNQIKIFFGLLLIVGAVTNGFTQNTSPDFVWLTSPEVHGTWGPQGKVIIADVNGNTFIAGKFTDTVSFGNISLVSTAGSSDIYVAKLNTNGSFIWAKQAAGPGTEYPKGITLDATGNIYVVGTFSNTCTFGNTTLTASGNQDGFVSKLDMNGNFIWAKQATGSGKEAINGIASDASGNILLTGDFKGTMTFFDSTFTSVGTGSNTFIAKVNNNGDLQWLKQVNGNNAGTALSVDANGNSFVAVNFAGTVVVADSTFTTANHGSWLVSKLNSSGSFEWAKHIGETASIEALTVSISGNIYITGTFSDSTGISGFPLNPQIGGEEVYIAKMGAAGQFAWVKQIQTTGGAGNMSNAIAVDADGNCYVTGRFYGDGWFGNEHLSTVSARWNVFVSQLDASGNFLWSALSKETGMSGASEGLGITLDTNHNCYVTGTLYSGGTFGNLPAPPSDNFNAFVLKIAIAGLGTEVSETFGGNKIFIYPNPVNNQLTIQTENEFDNATAVIMDIFGRVVLQEKLNQQQTNLNTSTLNSGVYFLQINADGKKVMKKFIKE